MILNYAVVACFLIFGFIEEITSAPTQENSLVLLHVIFRHGHRVPEGPDELYPKDPYLQETYFPIGLGQLTNAGKLRELSIGKALRERYNQFLGPVYYPQIVDPLSTDYNRTKMSLELVLAGLFPPKGRELWNSNLNWQPIPYNFLPRDEDKILMGTSCPHYLKLYEEQVHSPKWRAEFNKYRKIFGYISRNTGLNVTKFQEVYNLYFGLSAEKQWGFKLPPWTSKVWPKTITDLAIKEYHVGTATTDLNRMASGYFLQKLISDTNSIKNETDKKTRIHLYSAHEDNIAHLLILLKVFKPHIPPYGSYIVFQIHKIKNSLGIKILYENYTNGKPSVLKLPGCEVVCKFSKFVSLVDKYLPKHDLCGTKGCSR